MGYIAYAAGTLIAVAAVHTLITRKHLKNEDPVQVPESTPTFSFTEPEEVKEAESTPESQESTTIKSSVTIEFSHDGDQDETESDTPDTERQTRESTQTPSAREPFPEPAMNGHIAKPTFKAMPPPPRPASTPNLASLNRPRQSNMLPPSSLPPSRARSPPRLKPATVSSLAPSARPIPPQTGSSSLSPNPSSASSLRVPAQKVLANTHMQPQSALAPTTSTQPLSKRQSRKVILSPGHSPLDWAALSRSTSPDAPTKLRGADATNHLGSFRLGRITPSQLKKQTGRRGKDAWTVYQGRVYNISAYLDFHPGGRDELMKGAGRTSDTLFAEVHPWVNWEGMLGGCLVGMLVAEDDVEANSGGTVDGAGDGENELDQMD